MGGVKEGAMMCRQTGGRLGNSHPVGNHAKENVTVHGPNIIVSEIIQEVKTEDMSNEWVV